MGELTKDNSEFMKLEWRFGDHKLKNIKRTDQDSPNLTFVYNPLGVRVAKIKMPRSGGSNLPQEEWTVTYYTYDANGQLMSTYESELYTPSKRTSLEEQYIYGSKRVGVVKANQIVFEDVVIEVSTAPKKENVLGKKRYELTNHLGNVLATITDRKIYNPTGQYYEPVITMKADYYAGGMIMPGRSSNFDSYRFGFNGMESDNEVSGNGNSYDYGARMYNSRLMRWFSLDPRMSEFPGWSPYNFSFNSPLMYKDEDGEIPIIIIDKQSKTIMVYQPVFVVPEGPGSVELSELENIQNEFDEYINTDNMQAVSNIDGEKYDIVVKFQFFEGGSFSEAQKKNKEMRKNMGMNVHGTFSSFESDKEFEKNYIDKGGDKNPKDIGGITIRKRDIYMRGSSDTKRERTHEGFHLLLLDDTEGAVGIMKYTDGYGKGPGVNMKNVEDAINITMKNFGSIMRFDYPGNMTESDFSGETFKVRQKPKPIKTGTGSGMGGVHQSELKLKEISGITDGK